METGRDAPRGAHALRHPEVKALREDLLVARRRHGGWYLAGAAVLQEYYGEHSGIRMALCGGVAACTFHCATSSAVFIAASGCTTGSLTAPPGGTHGRCRHFTRPCVFH
jgi:hypothetical protein